MPNACLPMFAVGPMPQLSFPRPSAMGMCGVVCHRAVSDVHGCLCQHPTSAPTNRSATKRVVTSRDTVITFTDAQAPAEIGGMDSPAMAASVGSKRCWQWMSRAARPSSLVLARVNPKAPMADNPKAPMADNPKALIAARANPKAPMADNPKAGSTRANPKAPMADPPLSNHRPSYPSP